MKNQKTNSKKKKTSSKKTTSPAKNTNVEKNSESVASLKIQLEEKIALLTETNRQLKRKIFDLYTIFEISRNFNAVLDYYNLLDTFIFTCLGQVGALKGAIFLKKEVRGDRFFLVKSKGSGELPEPEQFFRTDSTLAQYLTSLNRPVPTAEVACDVAEPDEVAIVKMFEPGIIVPLVYQTRLTGIFLMSEKISGREFRLDDIEFLSILGNQIAVAIENARLYEGEKMAIQQLRSAQQQLVQTEKIAALGEMSAKVAHEVNNPLGIIKNYILLVERACRDNKETEEFVGIIGEEIDRIARIVKQLLDFHRPEGVTFQKVNVIQVINDVVTLMERQLASHNIELVKEFDDSRPYILGAPESLKQVFLNLIINSRDVLEKGGTITIEVTPTDKELRINFKDTGPGIHPDYIPRIFEPFFTTKELGKGTGLGLSVCYGIIKNHKGSITFKNLNPGSCFDIRFPSLFEE
ncbi:MAG: GAF domain-containing protein [candidate division Zixibacteria bacterium]|nr:GAF domain-containing protein [candidate division Zixibacteria bacterium]